MLEFDKKNYQLKSQYNYSASFSILASIATVFKLKEADKLLARHAILNL